MIDESLDPGVARALHEVGFNATSVTEVWGRQGVTDQEIIPWVGQRSGVWVHADDRAKKDHRNLLLASTISTLWVHRPKSGMSSADQLRAITYVLEDFLARQAQSRRPIHYRLTVHGMAQRQRIRLQSYDL